MNFGYSRVKVETTVDLMSHSSQFWMGTLNYEIIVQINKLPFVYYKKDSDWEAKYGYKQV